jgi:hypothetical protein
MVNLSSGGTHPAPGHDQVRKPRAACLLRDAHLQAPEDGQKMALAGMIGEMRSCCDTDLMGMAPTDISAVVGPR